MYKYLFFDDNKLFERKNFHREYGHPSLEGVYNDPVITTSMPTGHVFRMQDGTYKMLYQGNDVPRKEICVMAAASDDGIHFHPDNSAAEKASVESPAAPNQILPSFPDGCELVTVAEDKDAPSEERYKMLFSEVSFENSRVYNTLFVSEDAIRWRKQTGVYWHSRGAEPPGNCFYNPARKAFQIMTRPDWGDRRVAMIETSDWESFSAPKLVVSPDSEDAPLNEFYGACAIEYDGMCVGFLHVFKGFQEGLRHKFMGGTLSPELIYSYDGVYWKRSLRRPFISGSDPEYARRLGYEDKMIFPSSILRRPDGGMLIHGNGSRCEHGHFHGVPATSSIYSYSLRKDGFIKLVSDVKDEAASLATRENICLGGDLAVNLKAEKATAAVYVSDNPGWPDYSEFLAHSDCEAFSGDSTAWRPKWKNGMDLGALKGRTIVVQVKLFNGEIWSIGGDIQPLMTVEGLRYRTHGVPPRRLGF